MYIALITFEEILGKRGLSSLLNFNGLNAFIDAYPPNDLGLDQDLVDFNRLIIGAIELLGEAAARPILFRSGRRGMQMIIEQYPDLLGLGGVTPERAGRGARFERLGKIHRVLTDASIGLFGEIYTLYENKEGLVLDIDPCFWCHGAVSSSKPICHAAVGTSYELARWVLGDPVTVRETRCRAKGDECCRIVIFRPEPDER